jgi:hypothetical protein
MNYFFNSANENIIVYNGEFLSEDIRDNVTRSIENLFNNCISIYDRKVYRSNHCIWYILSKNMPEYFLITSLKNVFAKAINKEILKNTLQSHPTILQNYAIPQSYLYLNFIQDLSSTLVNTQDVNYDNFDLLS